MNSILFFALMCVFLQGAVLGSSQYQLAGEVQASGLRLQGATQVTLGSSTTFNLMVAVGNSSCLLMNGANVFMTLHLNNSNSVLSCAVIQVGSKTQAILGSTSNTFVYDLSLSGMSAVPLQTLPARGDFVSTGYLAPNPSTLLLSVVQNSNKHIVVYIWNGAAWTLIGTYTAPASLLAVTIFPSGPTHSDVVCETANGLWLLSCYNNHCQDGNAAWAGFFGVDVFLNNSNIFIWGVENGKATLIAWAGYNGQGVGQFATVRTPTMPKNVTVYETMGFDNVAGSVFVNTNGSTVLLNGNNSVMWQGPAGTHTRYILGNTTWIYIQTGNNTVQVFTSIPTASASKSVSHSHSKSNTRSHSESRKMTHSASHARSHSESHKVTRSESRKMFHSMSHARNHTASLARSHSESHKVTRSESRKMSHSMSHARTRSESHGRSHSESHKMTYSASHARSHSESRKVTPSESRNMVHSASHAKNHSKSPTESGSLSPSSSISPSNASLDTDNETATAFSTMIQTASQSQNGTNTTFVHKTKASESASPTPIKFSKFHHLDFKYILIIIVGTLVVLTLLYFCCERRYRKRAQTAMWKEGDVEGGRNNLSPLYDQELTEFA